MATKKSTKRKKATSSKLDAVIGHDARNGKVTMMSDTVDGVKGYTITNERTGYTAFEATRQKALPLYNEQVNNSSK
jgi:hypothetical protein